MTRLTLLDLSPIAEGSDAGRALRNSIELAQFAERLGYHRFWMAEHHNMPGIASAATAIALAYMVQATSTIRIGAGGIMLPNHSPLVVAEQFGTLEAMHPGRIDLGLGRAPGSDQTTARALRRAQPQTVDTFPQDVVEVLNYFEAAQPGQAVRATPGEGLRVPVWMLGSSLYGAQLAAALGLPYGFAAHFAPDLMAQAVQVYRQRFKPSERLAKPYVGIGLNVFAAPTDAQAQRLFTSLQREFAHLRIGRATRLPAPVDDIASVLTPVEQTSVHHILRATVFGSQQTVRRGLAKVVALTGADELMVTAQIFDHSDRMRSFELVAGVAGDLNVKAA